MNNRMHQCGQRGGRRWLTIGRRHFYKRVQLLFSRLRFADGIFSYGTFLRRHSIRQQFPYGFFQTPPPEWGH